MEDHELVFESKPGAKKKVLLSYPLNEGYPEKPLNRHLIRIFNECAGVPDAGMGMECTLTEKEEVFGAQLRAQYGRYVSLHVLAGWSPYKNWYEDRWQEVMERLFKKGIVVIQIGASWDPAILNTVDMRGHTIKEAVSVIKHAAVHMGVDSFSNHASAAVGTRAVILFGSTSPIGSGYPGNKNIWKSSLECSPCYREFVNKMENPCPYNKKCMDQITVDEVALAVEELYGLSKGL